MPVLFASAQSLSAASVLALLVFFGALHLRNNCDPLNFLLLSLPTVAPHSPHTHSPCTLEPAPRQGKRQGKLIACMPASTQCLYGFHKVGHALAALQPASSHRQTTQVRALPLATYTYTCVAGQPPAYKQLLSLPYTQSLSITAASVGPTPKLERARPHNGRLECGFGGGLCTSARGLCSSSRP